MGDRVMTTIEVSDSIRIDGILRVTRKNIVTGEEDSRDYHNVTTILGKNAFLDLMGASLTLGAQIFEIGTGSGISYSEGTTKLTTAVARNAINAYTRSINKQGLYESFMGPYTPSTDQTIGEVGIFGRGATTASGTGELWAVVTVSPTVQKLAGVHTLDVQYTWQVA